MSGMELTHEQYERIADCLPVQRGNVRHDNLVLLNAILCVAEHGCKGRGLARRFGNWHSIYVRMNRWAKKGVLDQVFAKLQEEHSGSLFAGSQQAEPCRVLSHCFK